MIVALVAFMALAYLAGALAGEGVGRLATGKGNAYPFIALGVVSGLLSFWVIGTFL